MILGHPGSEYLVLPVGAIILKNRYVVKYGRQFSHYPVRINILRIFRSIHYIQLFAYLLKGTEYIVSDNRLLAAALFSRNQDNPAGSPRAINGSSRSIFQNFNRLDIIRMYIRHRAALHSVDDNQRVTCGID